MPDAAPPASTPPASTEIVRLPGASRSTDAGEKRTDPADAELPAEHPDQSAPTLKPTAEPLSLRLSAAANVAGVEREGLGHRDLGHEILLDVKNDGPPENDHAQRSSGVDEVDGLHVDCRFPIR